jgi:hypothetical protein
MKECESCGKSLIDALDVVLFLLGPLQFFFGIWVLLNGDVLGFANILVALIATIGLVARRRTCTACADANRGHEGKAA